MEGVYREPFVRNLKTVFRQANTIHYAANVFRICRHAVPSILSDKGVENVLQDF